MSADYTPSTPPSEERLPSEIANLAKAHASVSAAVGRMMSALSAGHDGLARIEQLRLQSAVDQYRNWAADIQAALEASEEDTADLRMRLAQMQDEFRAALHSLAAELALRAGPGGEASGLGERS